MKKTVYFLLLCVSAIFYSCSEDDISKSIHTHENSENLHVKKTKIGFQEMENYLREHANSSFPISLNSTYGKDGDSYITGIDSTAITQITDDIVTSFTLRVHTLDDELYAYSNLVIKSYNGQAEEYILHYNPTPEWQSAFDAGQRLPYEGELMLTDINGEELSLEEDSNGESGRMAAGTCLLEVNVACYGPSCPCTDGNGQTFYITVSCGSGGGESNGSGTGSSGPNNNGFPTEPNPGGGSGNYTAFDYFMMDLNNDQLAWLTANTTIMSQIYNYLQTYGQPNPNGWYDNSDAVNFALELVEFLEEENGIKDNLRQAIANGITTTAEYTHKVFKKFSQWTNQYPSSITLINTILSGIKYSISDLVNTNPNTCTFKDLFNMWLFELGTNPININGLKTTTNQLKIQQGVNTARAIAISNIENGNFNPISYGWTYGQGEFYDGMQNGNFVTAFLGSYTTHVTITTIPGGHQLNFQVTNTSGWESATRFRIDNDGNGIHDGVFPNTYRNISTDISLGGNFTQNWNWTEIVN